MPDNSLYIDTKSQDYTPLSLDEASNRVAIRVGIGDLSSFPFPVHLGLTNKCIVGFEAWFPLSSCFDSYLLLTTHFHAYALYLCAMLTSIDCHFIAFYGLMGTLFPLLSYYCFVLLHLFKSEHSIGFAPLHVRGAFSLLFLIVSHWFSFICIWHYYRGTITCLSASWLVLDWLSYFRCF